MGRMEEQPRQGEDCVMAVAAAAPQPLDVLWKALMELFKQQRPSEAQLTEVSGIATLALRVAASPDRYGYTQPSADDIRDLLADVAEVGSLYGYWLGYHQGQQANART